MQSDAPKTPNPFVDILKRMGNALRRRPLQKLAALFLAIVFWAVVIANDPTLVIEKTIANAPVSVTGQTVLLNRGLIVMDDLTRGTITVRMRVQVRQADYESANASTFQPKLDLDSQITQAGPNQEVFFTATNTSTSKVISFDPPSIPITVENYTSRSRIGIVVEKQGESGEPLWVTNISTDPAQITVNGPQSVVSKINRAVVVLPMESLSAARTSDSITALLELQDADGKAITSPLLNITSDSVKVDSVNISLDIYPMREIPVDVESAITGIPEHGYEVTGVNLSPETIAVAAPQDVLDTLDAIYISAPVDVSRASSVEPTPVTIRSIPDSVHIATNTVVVEPIITPAEHVHVYNNIPLKIIGLDAGLAASLGQDVMDVILHGDYDKVQGLKADDITLYVDATGLTEGLHTLDVLCIVNGTDEFTFEAEYPTVLLTLTPVTTAENP